MGVDFDYMAQNEVWCLMLGTKKMWPISLKTLLTAPPTSSSPGELLLVTLETYSLLVFLQVVLCFLCLLHE